MRGVDQSIWASWFFLMALSACAAQSRFGSPANPKKPSSPEVNAQSGTNTNSDPSDSANRQGPVNKNSQSSVQSSISSSRNSTCTPEGITKIRLLSPSVVSGDPQNHLEYEISAVDCAGNPLNNLKGSIDFDIGAVTSIADSGLAYTAFDGTKTQNGKLEAVSGQDLFGNSGPEFQFFRTSEVIELNSSTKSVQFLIKLAGATIESYTSRDGSGSTVATYLRFGSAAPVEQSVKLISEKNP